MGGTCFLQDNSVCFLIIIKVDDGYRMDCH